MANYHVLVTEIYQKVVDFEAESEAEARQMASDAWNNTEFILEPEDCFQGVEFYAKEVGEECWK